MSKITDYPSATEIGAGDVILLDGSKGTQKATGKVAADSFGKLYNSLTYGDQTSYLVVDKKTVNVQSGWCRIYESGGVGTGFWENIGAFFEISCNIRNQEVHSVYLSSIEAGVCKFKPH